MSTKDWFVSISLFVLLTVWYIELASKDSNLDIDTIVGCYYRNDQSIIIDTGRIMVEKLSISYRIDRDNFGTYIMPSRRLNFRDDRPHFGHGIPLGIRVHTNPDIRLGVFDDNTNDELVFIKADCL